MSTDFKRLRETQTRRLQRLLETLSETNSFYRHKLASTDAPDRIDLETLEHLPFTTKTELVEDQEKHPPYGTNLTFERSLYVRSHQTSGTTGRPLRWLDTRDSWQWFRDCWAEILGEAGVTGDDCVFVAFSFGPFIGFWGAFEAAQQMGCLTLSGGALTTEQRLESLLDHQASVLISTPAYALRLAETARRRGIDLASSSVRLTLHAGEPGASVPNVRKQLESSWGARCVDHAGATEVGAWGVTPEADGRMRVLEDHFIAEVVEPSTSTLVSPSEDGALEGELVLTNLGRLGSPVLRYRTGDLVQMVPGSQEGDVYSHLRGGVLARADDMIIVRGVNVYPSAIENLVRAFPEIGEFRVTIEKSNEMTELDIEIELGSEAATSVASALAEHVHGRLSLRPRVAIVEHGTLPRFELKAKRFRIARQDAGRGTGM